jgi:hyperosmotically inducible protein
MLKKIWLGSLVGVSLLIVLAVPGRAQDRTMSDLTADSIRHQLATLPYYNVFDWLEGEVRPDGSVVLRGEVVEPSTRADAEWRVRKIEGVTSITNEIKVLPPGSTDNRYRIALYRAIYRYDSPLFRYSTQAVPPIHIVVDNGRVILKGAVSSATESQLAYTAARHVAGLFDVQNELQVVTE